MLPPTVVEEKWTSTRLMIWLDEESVAPLLPVLCPWCDPGRRRSVPTAAPAGT